MEIATVRDAIVTRLKADTALTAQIGASLIDYGIGKQITKDLTPKSIRVVSLGIEPETVEEFSGAGNTIAEVYRFHVAVFFEDTGVKTTEDKLSLYTRLVKKAITKESTLGNTVADTDIKRTFFRHISDDDNTHVIIIEVNAYNYVDSVTR